MVKGRKEEIVVAFLDMEKAYDRVNRKKLFEVFRCYGVHEKLVRLIESSITTRCILPVR